MTNHGRLEVAESVVYVGLGSNLGDREANLREAIGQIRSLGIEITRESSVYETEPVGFKDQPWFLNQVIEIKGSGSEDSAHGSNVADQAGAFLSGLLEIEREMGRERALVNGPRPIDIDLLLYGEAILGYSERKERPVVESGIVVPHPRMHLRRFVLEPMCEIAPDVEHPVLKKKIRELLSYLKDESAVKIFLR